jgi:SH3 domain protein
MRFFLSFSFCLTLFFALPSFSQESPQETAVAESTDNEKINYAYISDELFIFMRSGPGKQYRLLGSITAGTQIVLTGNNENGFQEITDGKNRRGWIETQYITKTSGLRAVIAELNAQLASKDENINQAKINLLAAQQQLEQLSKNNEQLQTKIISLNKKLSTTTEKFELQDNGLKKEWFFNGAIVLGIGLFLGLIFSRLSGRRRNSMESWQ